MPRLHPHVEKHDLLQVDHQFPMRLIEVLLAGFQHWFNAELDHHTNFAWKLDQLVSHLTAKGDDRFNFIRTRDRAAWMKLLFQHAPCVHRAAHFSHPSPVHTAQLVESLNSVRVAWPCRLKTELNYSTWLKLTIELFKHNITYHLKPCHSLIQYIQAANENTMQ